MGDIAKWKATEYRMFLLYCGPLILEDILPKNLYKHFMLLHVACRILSCNEQWKVYLPVAEKYLENFVLLAQELYGLTSQVLNVHSLVHLADDVLNLQCSLSDMVAFSFENLLEIIKKSLKSGYKPLHQYVKKMEAQATLKQATIEKPSKRKIISEKKKDGMLQVMKIQYCNYEISRKEPNNAVLLKQVGATELIHVGLTELIHVGTYFFACSYSFINAGIKIKEIFFLANFLLQI